MAIEAETSPPHPTVALIVAAGRGSRAAVAGAGPKQYVRLAGRAVLAHALQPFLNCDAIDFVVVVIHPDDAAAYAEAVAGVTNGAKLLAPVHGGATRQNSVLAGLAAIEREMPARVLIHDAARPFVTQSVIQRTLEAMANVDGAVAAVPLVDTLKRSDARGRVTGTTSRDGLWRAQTPQAFIYPALLAAHRAAAAQGRTDFTDDSAVAEWHGLAISIAQGDPANVKLTTPEDIRMAEAATVAQSMPQIRVGQGFDVHRFKDGDHVWLCGVRVPHSHGVEAHSDGDVALHALTDALLGAIADGDIGLHFKNTDPQWRGASSDLFLADAVRRVAMLGGGIVNVDVTILSEAPKIAPHRDAMRARMAEVLGIAPSRIGLKATTTERLGFIGRKEGLAAMAIATVVLP